MIRSSFSSLLALAVFAALTPASGQRFAATQAAHSQVESAASGVVQNSFGQSVAPLNGPWKFQIGDSPVDAATHTPKWAEPGFDDSRWETVDLSPIAGSVDPYNGDPRYITGWTAKGHPGYMGFAWYRLSVPVAARNGDRLALANPIYVDDGYQVFANGELLGSFGEFGDPGKPPVVYSTGPWMLMLPKSAADAHASAGPTIQTIAFRVWMGPMGLTHSPYAGGLHYAPLLGEASAIEAQTRLEWLEITKEGAFAPVEGVLLLLLAIVSASLVLFDRSDQVYLWVAGVLLFTALSDAALFVFTLTQWLSLRTYFMFFDVFVNPLQLCGWIMVWWHWFQLRRPAWLPKAIGGMMLLYMISKSLGGDFFYGATLQPPSVMFNAVSVAVRLLFLPLLVFVVGFGIRKQGGEGWLVLPAVVPLAISQFSSELIVLNLPVKWAPFGITIFVSEVSNLASAAAISLLLLRRLLLSMRRQRERALDLKQAQEMQRMLIPDTLLELPGFALSSAYRPALEVGGDFFQIIPLEGGGTQILLGDVSGKGLKAAMAVSQIVGTIRVLADQCREPAELLNQLNRRLHDRLQGGFATCIAMRLDPDGRCTLSSAGHPPPFLNARELVLPGALPLGLMHVSSYEEIHLHLHENDHLVLYTDGLVETRNASRELYGFDRLRALFASNPTVHEAMEAAVKFGVDDDITVLILTRLRSTEQPAEGYPATALSSA